MFRGYRKFDSLAHTATNLRHLYHQRGGLLSEALTSLGYTVFNRYSALRNSHPMSGGVGRKRLDHVNDFLDLRRALFDFELVPLPQSLQLPQADQALNRIANRTLQRALAVASPQ
ncbi:MAG: hypothetical protein M3410_17735 [Acidobacteriota bacterium]|nr:hypothetical protein [Acidobacteriota bacterium]